MRHHVVAEPLKRILGGKSPVGGTGGEDFNDGKALFVYLILESLFDRRLGFTHVGGIVNGNAMRVCDAVKGGEHLADFYGIALNLGVASVGGGCRDLTFERGGRHLTARHAVNAVVDEDDGDVFAAGCGMNSLGGADRGEVAVALICKYNSVGMRALNARCNCGGASVGSLDHITVEIIVRENGAAYGSDTYGAALDAKLVNDLGDKTVNDAVSAAGAVMHSNVGKSLGFIKYY